MGLIKKLRKYITGKKIEWPIHFSSNILLEDIKLRDPFIFKESGIYYLTGTIYRLNYNDSYGIVMYKSHDLKTFNGPYTIIKKEKLDKLYQNFWAPEIYKIKNKYYIVTTLKSSDEKLGSYLFVSDKIDGDYKLLSRITPKDYASLDATLFEEDGSLYSIYCHEYTDCVDGEIRYVKLKEDLTDIELETDTLMFKGSSNNYKQTLLMKKITDGPYVIKDKENLHLIWSTEIRGGRYVQLIEKSSNGKLSGFSGNNSVLMDINGGHGMVFETFDKQRKLIMHYPNKRRIFPKVFEHPVIFDYKVED